MMFPFRFGLVRQTLPPAVLSILLTITVLANQEPSEKKPEAKDQSKEQINFTAEAQARISQFTLPEGVRAELFADASQTQNPGAICFDGQGKLYVAEVHRWRDGVEEIRDQQRLLLDDLDNVTIKDRQEMYERDQIARPISHYTKFADRIVVLDDTNNDGRADSSKVFADDFNDVLDGAGIGLLATEDGSIYYTNIPHLWRLKDSNNDDTADVRESLQTGFGVRMSISGHDMHGLVRGPDGKIYWSIGDRGYHISTKEGRHYSRPVEGAVFRCDPDGSNLEEYYRGLRNPQELAFDQYGNLFTVDNDADHDDLARLVYIIEGGNSGWTHGHQVIMNFRTQYGLRTPEYQDVESDKLRPLTPWNTEKIWNPDFPNRPEFALPPVKNISWGPSGLVYNYGITAMPDRYAEHFWVCNFGGGKGNLEAFTVTPKGAGFAIGNHENPFMVGIGNTDVEFGPDGKMYLCCFNNSGWKKENIGNVYTLFDDSKLNSELLNLTEELLSKDFIEIEVEDLSELLGFGDMRVRQKAQFELVDRGNSEALINSVKQSQNRLKRLHGVWGLGQLARSDQAIYQYHIEYLNDPDDEVRAQSAKILADSRLPENGKALLELLSRESSAKVKAFAAIGVGKCGLPEAIPALVDLLEVNNNQDAFLRHGCIQGLWFLNEKEKILKLVNHESAAVRIAILLTLRKLEDPRVSYFLKDSEESIRYAAIRAINDLNLFPAIPALAKHIENYTQSTENFRLPDSAGDWIIQHRLINANFREGTQESARRLINYAAAEHLPELLRLQAMDALLEWPHPTVVDPTVGLYRPLDTATRAKIDETVQENFPPVFSTVSGNLLTKATAVALQYDCEVPAKLLVSLINDPSATDSARTGAMTGLSLQDPEQMPLWIELLADESPEIRGKACQLILNKNSARGIPEAFKLSDSANLRDRQLAFQNLATIESERVGDFFADRMKQLSSEKPGAVLDLVEAAKQRPEVEVKRAIELYLEEHPANTLSHFEPCLEGGDADKGKAIFLNHATGLCAKCHRVDKDGGEAGPELTDIGARSTPKEILKSLVDPNAEIAPGYGVTIINLTDGTSIGGTLIDKQDDQVSIKVKDEKTGKLTDQTIAMNQISSINQPPSAMPPMGMILKKTEIRDLVAYLARLNGKKGKTKKH